ELLVGTNETKQLIQSRARTADMLNAAIHSGMQTLLGDGIRKVVQGLTNLPAGTRRRGEVGKDAWVHSDTKPPVSMQQNGTKGKHCLHSDFRSRRPITVRPTLLNFTALP